MEESFPADPLLPGSHYIHCGNSGLMTGVCLIPRNYAGPASLEKDGNVLLRPWHLPWEPHCGLKGMCEIDFWICIKYVFKQFIVIEFERKIREFQRDIMCMIFR